EPTHDVSALHSSVIDVIDTYQLGDLMDRSDGYHAVLQEPPSSVPPPGLELAMGTLTTAFRRVQQKGSRGYWLFGPRGTGKSFWLRYTTGLFTGTGCACHTAYLSPVCPSRPFAVISLWLERAAGLLAINDRRAARETAHALADKLGLSDAQRMALEILCG